MARAGVASRRKSEQLILEGQVTVNGETVTELGTKVTATDDVRVAGRRIAPERDHVYVALNKPRKYICSASDPEGRPLAVELLKNDYSERLFSVGRLDFLSSGLILFTNDGEFARAVAHPSSRIEKEYRVDAQKPIPEALLEQYKRGIVIDGETYTLTSYRYKNPRTIRLVLVEGKNREIRRVFAHWRIGVKRIHRVRIGIVRLGELPSGSHRPLSVKEIDWLLSASRSGADKKGRSSGGSQ
jgi:23S rRNA pseudouridine2605 synthase